MVPWPAVIVALVLTSGLGPVMDSMPGVFFHEPIRIVGDDEFVAANGVVAGAGTAADPYIISGWSILALGSSGIALENTTKHVLVEANRVETAFFDPVEEYSAGVKLIGVANVTIRNNVLHASQFGVHIRESAAVVVSGNTVVGVQVPMQSFFVASNGGIHAIDTAGAVFAHNEIQNFGWGITTEGTGRDLVIADNTISKILFSGAVNLLHAMSNSTIAGNRIFRAPVGVYVLGAENISVAHNKISDVENGFDFDAQIIGGIRHSATEVVATENRIEDVSYLGLIGDCDRCRIMNNLMRESTEGIIAYEDRAVEIAYNQFEANEIVFPAETDQSVVIHNNSIDLSNDRYAHVHEGTLDLRQNWWGSAAGPDMDRFLLEGDAAVLVSPWRVAPP